MEIISLILGITAALLANAINAWLGGYFKRQGQKIEIKFDDGKQKEVIIFAEGVSGTELLEQIKAITSKTDLKSDVDGPIT